VTGAFIGHSGGGELSKLLVNERKQFLGGPGVAAFDGVEDLSDIAHDSRWFHQEHIHLRFAHEPIL
jgi:hypothetical protein